VSRAHAKIEVESDGMYLYDTGSKFGTLVAAKRPIVIDPNIITTL
jgi:hypothetical protein